MTKDETTKELERTVKEYDIDNVELIVNSAIKQGIDPIECFNSFVKSIASIGEAFGKGELYLPDLIAASDVVKKAMPLIKAELDKKGEKIQSKGRIVIGTVAGDIHNIGKDMVSTLLYSSGYEVIDLGVDVNKERFIDAIESSKAEILAMSALLTTTITELKKVIEALKEKGIRDKIKVMIGGAPVNQDFADNIGADGYGATASNAVELAKKFLR
ncbi:MAG: corrinoid protein [Actinobacteria bacterium]|nr:corrinoid protein [Actinomycetota bacterium]